MHDDLFDLPAPHYKRVTAALLLYMDYLSEAEEPVDIVAVGSPDQPGLLPKP